MLKDDSLEKRLNMDKDTQNRSKVMKVRHVSITDCSVCIALLC